jgi:hypothetical protein
MFNIFKKIFKKKITEIAEEFLIWERMLKVDLYTKFVDRNLAKGMPEETAKVIAAQGVNYITGEDWEKNLQSATEEIKRIVDKHKSEIIPSVNAMLETDKMCREVIVNYLRIKSVLLSAMTGNEYMESDTKKRIEEILLTYGLEFPEEADPIKFGKLMLDFHYTIFPKK